MLQRLLFTAFAALAMTTASADEALRRTTYSNPVLPHDCADPAVIRAADGYFYAYGTGGGAIWRSKNLIDWG